MREPISGLKGKTGRKGGKSNELKARPILINQRGRDAAKPKHSHNSRRN